MAQSFGFWRIAVSNLAAVFIVAMTVPLISFCKEHVIHLISVEFAADLVVRLDGVQTGSKQGRTKCDLEPKPLRGFMYITVIAWLA